MTSSASTPPEAGAAQSVLSKHHALRFRLFFILMPIFDYDARNHHAKAPSMMLSAASAAGVARQSRLEWRRSPCQNARSVFTGLSPCLLLYGFRDFRHHVVDIRYFAASFAVRLILRRENAFPRWRQSSVAPQNVE
jgi:hypothetical protein